MTGRITWLPEWRRWSQRQQDAGGWVPDLLPEMREKYGVGGCQLSLGAAQLQAMTPDQRSIAVDAEIQAWRDGAGTVIAAINDVADAVQDGNYALLRDRPHADDVNLTLALLAEGRHPRGDEHDEHDERDDRNERRKCDVLDIDWMSHAELHRHAWLLFGDRSAESFENLTPQQLSDEQLRLAATTALAARESGPGGRPPTSDRAGVPIVDAVLRAWEGSLRAAELAKLRESALMRGIRRHHVGDAESKAETSQLTRARLQFFMSCLAACGIKASEKNIQQLITKARAGRVV